MVRASRWRGRRVLGALLLGAVALEVGFRVWLHVLAPPEKVGKYARATDLPPEALRYRPHPYLAYVLNPDFTSPGGGTHHNALGFRGPELAREKAPGTRRVVLLGGSTTYDSEIERDEETFAARLEALLREGGVAVEVLNAGAPGYTSWESWILLELRVLELEPDLVVVSHGTNDVNARVVDPARYRRDGTGYRRAWSEEPRPWDASLVLRWIGVQTGLSQRNALGDRVRAPQPAGLDPAASLAANDLAPVLENHRALAALARARGVRVMFASQARCPRLDDVESGPAHGSALDAHNAALARLAAELGVASYDHAAEMPADAELWADGRHVNEAGARVKARLYAEHLLASGLLE